MDVDVKEANKRTLTPQLIIAVGTVRLERALANIHVWACSYTRMFLVRLNASTLGVELKTDNGTTLLRQNVGAATSHARGAKDRGRTVVNLVRCGS
jgi:hypothetical protein